MADFSVDAEIRADVSKSTLDAADIVRDLGIAIKATYESIGSEGYWKGDSYDSFKTMCDNFMPTIEATEQLLRVMANIINEQVTVYQDELETALDGALS